MDRQSSQDITGRKARGLTAAHVWRIHAHLSERRQKALLSATVFNGKKWLKTLARSGIKRAYLTTLWIPCFILCLQGEELTSSCRWTGGGGGGARRQGGHLASETLLERTDQKWHQAGHANVFHGNVQIAPSSDPAAISAIPVFTCLTLDTDLKFSGTAYCRNFWQKHPINPLFLCSFIRLSKWPSWMWLWRAGGQQYSASQLC